MVGPYKDYPLLVNGKSPPPSDGMSAVHTRALQAALWRLYGEPKPPMRILADAYDVSVSTIAKAVQELGNGGVPKGHVKRNGHNEVPTARERLAALVVEFGGMGDTLNALAGLEAQ